MVDFDVTRATERVGQVLPSYAGRLGTEASFEEVSPLELTPDKPYTARGSVAIRYAGREIGTMVVIAFAPGDGTGNTADLAPGTIVLPERFKYRPAETGGWRKSTAAEVARCHPRVKSGFEAYLPLVTIVDGDAFPLVGSLELLTVNEHSPDRGGKREIIKAWDLGMSPVEYEVLRVRQRNMEGVSARLTLTTGYGAEGAQFGSPHAVYHNPMMPEAVQIAGFIAVKEAQNPLWELFSAMEAPRPTWAEPLPLPEQPKKH